MDEFNEGDMEENNRKDWLFSALGLQGLNTHSSRDLISLKRKLINALRDILRKSSNMTEYRRSKTLNIFDVIYGINFIFVTLKMEKKYLIFDDSAAIISVADDLSYDRNIDSQLKDIHNSVEDDDFDYVSSDEESESDSDSDSEIDIHDNYLSEEDMDLQHPIYCGTWYRNVVPLMDKYFANIDPSLLIHDETLSQTNDKGDISVKNDFSRYGEFGSLIEIFFDFKTNLMFTDYTCSLSFIVLLKEFLVYYSKVIMKNLNWSRRKNFILYVNPFLSSPPQGSTINSNTIYSRSIMPSSPHLLLSVSEVFSNKDLVQEISKFI